MVFFMMPLIIEIKIKLKIEIKSFNFECVTKLVKKLQIIISIYLYGEIYKNSHLKWLPLNVNKFDHSL